MVSGKESGCGEGVRLFADSRFGVRETGFALNALYGFEFHLPSNMW